MSNPILLADDLAANTYAWSAGVNSSYPVSNLQTYYPDQVSKSNATTDAQTFTIDLGSAKAVDAVVIQGTNFTSLGATSVKLQFDFDDDPGFATPVDAVTFTADMEYSAFTLSGGSTKRYFRILFTKGSALSAAPQIGNIFIGTKLQFETTQNWGHYTNHPDYSQGTYQSRAKDGRARTAEVFGAIRRHKINFDQGNVQSDTLITAFLTFLDVARGKFFYYIDNNGDVYYVKWARNFNPWESFRYNQNKIPNLEMESVMAG